jgi:hypothetical protein
MISIAESVRFGFRRFFEREERRAFNLNVREALKHHGDEAAQVIKIKSRLVAGGHLQTQR